MDVEKEIAGVKNVPQIATLEKAVCKLIHLLWCLPKENLSQI